MEALTLLGIESSGNDVSDLFPPGVCRLEDGHVGICGRLLVDETEITLRFGRGNRETTRRTVRLRQDKARSTGLIGQTQTPLVIGDDRMLVVYRRTDEPGLWLQDVRIEGDEWVNAGTQPLWGHSQQGSTRMGDSMVENFRALRFGAPSVVRLDDEAVFVVFWCYEDNVSVIRWFRLELTDEA